MSTKLVILALCLVSKLSFAQVCEVQYQEFTGFADVFEFTNVHEIKVLQSERVVINEKTKKGQKLVITDAQKKSRTIFMIDRQDGHIASITKLAPHQKPETKKFDKSCIEEQAMMDENTRTKIDAMEANQKDSAR